jgi:1,4-dihydroxy-2-naphthoate octaprenyltransferase
MAGFAHDEAYVKLAHLPQPLLWVIAARLKTLSLSQMPVLAGTWLAAQHADCRLDAMVLAMLAAGAIQVGTNLWNDAADAARGIDGPERLGPPRLTALGLLDGKMVRIAAAGVFAFAALAGLGLVAIGGWPIVLVGVMSLALGYFYSMGPHPMSGQPYGELLVIAFFGLIAVAGTAYLHGAPPSPEVWITGLMIGFPAAAVLLLNNHRDRRGDAAAGRRTLAILVGPLGARVLYFLFLLAGLGLGVILAPCPALLPAAGLALWLGHAVTHWPIDARLNRLLGQTALYQGVLLFGVVAGRAICV